MLLAVHGCWDGCSGGCRLLLTPTWLFWTAICDRYVCCYTVVSVGLVPDAAGQLVVAVIED